jgi:hypothetical protein
MLAGPPPALDVDPFHVRTGRPAGTRFALTVWDRAFLDGLAEDPPPAPRE